jgi:TorA maturation chaperone TorD
MIGHYMPTADLHYFLSNLLMSGPSRECVADLWGDAFPAFPDALLKNGDIKEGYGSLLALKKRFTRQEDFYSAFQGEFTRLFLGGPEMVHPYESVYLDTMNIGGVMLNGLMMGESSDRVKEFYSAYGFGKTVNLPEDHISFELAFLGRLHSLHENAGDDAYLSAAKKFHEEHLVRWVPRFCDDLYDAADLFKPVAKILKGLALYEYEALMLTSTNQLEALSPSRGNADKTRS